MHSFVWMKRCVFLKHLNSSKCLVRDIIWGIKLEADIVANDLSLE